jgi:5S rRNA maturation endonuclease (ribonuclease M5)
MRPDDPMGLVLDALRARGPVTRSGEGWAARCPAHPDRDPSLSVGAGEDGRALLHCHAGCGLQEIVEALGLTVRELHPPRTAAPPAAPPRPWVRPPRRERDTDHDYPDADGRPSVRVTRWRLTDPDSGQRVGKSFTQSHWDGGRWVAGLNGHRPPLYRLPAVLDAIAAGRPIYVVEGEKDADTLTSLGAAATCNPMGAGRWREQHTGQLRGASHVTVIADDDQPGRAHARHILQQLAAAGIPCDGRLPAEGAKDITEHLAAGLHEPDLRTLHPEPDPEPGRAEEDDDGFAFDVALEARRLRIREAARQRLAAETAARTRPLEPIGMSGFIEQAERNPEWAVEEMWPQGGRVILAAQAKSGKTTIVCHNLLPALADGERFLGRFDTAPTGGILYLNLEVGADMMRRWLRRTGIANTAAIHIANLRGQVGAISISSGEGRAKFAEQIRAVGARTVILDPLAPLLAALGLDEDSNSDVARFFDWWGSALNLAGVRQDLITHHMGHEGKRSRGASRLLDEPDAVWTLTRAEQPDDDDVEAESSTGPRFLTATGRDVDVPQKGLAFNPATGRLTLIDGTPAQQRRAVEEARREQRILQALTDHPDGLSGRQIIRRGGGRERMASALERLVRTGKVMCSEGAAAGGGDLYWLVSARDGRT